ncbi:MAG TPA: hypothetical protein VFM63_00290 [Pyrinomonadaceae bacterium]|nr:hypothetical protein [Pyrinomonadaceae bacterium]
MKSFTRKLILVAMTLAVVLAGQISSAAPALPNPVLFMTGSEPVTISGKELIRYRYDVFNKGAYPAELFAASPNLPPCGANTKASRTWVDIYDQNGKRLNGFCALGKPADLGQLWFAMPVDALPPSWVYIEMNDRQTNTKYKSNLAETAM